MAFTNWRNVAITDIAFYALALIVSIYPAYRIVVVKKSYFKWFFVRFLILLLVKVAGGCTTVAFIHDVNKSDGSDYNVGLLIASLILNTIATGVIIFLYVYTTVYISKVAHNGEKQKNFKFGIIGIKYLFANPTDVNAWEGLVERLTFIGLILNSTGGGFSGGDNLSTSKALLEAGSILYLISFIGATICTLSKFIDQSKNSGSISVQKSTRSILLILLLASPFMLVRIINSILSAFSMHTTGGYIESFSRFTFLVGDWKLFTFMTFLEECVAVALLIVITYIIPSVNEYPNFTTTSESSKVDQEEDY